MFLFAIVLVVLTTAYFLLGIASLRALCDPLRNPDSSNFVAFVDDLIKFNDVNVTSVLTDCRANQSVYKVLNLKTQFDLNKVRNFWEEYHIDDAIGELENLISYDFSNIELLSEKAEESLTELIKVKISDIPLDKFVEEVNNPNSFNKL